MWCVGVRTFICSRARACLLAASRCNIDIVPRIFYLGLSRHGEVHGAVFAPCKVPCREVSAILNQDIGNDHDHEPRSLEEHIAAFASLAARKYRCEEGLAVIVGLPVGRVLHIRDSGWRKRTPDSTFCPASVTHCGWTISRIICKYTCMCIYIATSTAFAASVALHRIVDTRLGIVAKATSIPIASKAVPDHQRAGFLKLSNMFRRAVEYLVNSA